MSFRSGLDVLPTAVPLGFQYGGGVFGPEPELRSLDSIRRSLRDPNCDGPDPVYAIVMDVGRLEHRQGLIRRMLLFGVVTYTAGRLGSEPVRSQGHIHRVSRHSGWSPPELYEIWGGRAFILMQERAADDPGRSFAIEAAPGDKVLVPPGWAHAAISADPNQPLTFGALCDREYGFEYDEVRQRGGLAWYPVLDGHGTVRWEHNHAYRLRPLEVRGPRAYPDFHIDPTCAVYSQMTANLDRFQWVSKPAMKAEAWIGFEP